MDLQRNIFYKYKGGFLSLLFEHSQLARYAISIIGRFPDADAISMGIERFSCNDHLFNKSFAIIKLIVNKIRKRANGTIIFAFSANEKQPYNSEFKKIALSENIKFIDGVPEAVKSYEQNGFISRAADLDHWNELGHKIVADKIYDYFVDHGYWSICRQQRCYCITTAKPPKDCQG